MDTNYVKKSNTASDTAAAVNHTSIMIYLRHLMHQQNW